MVKYVKHFRFYLLTVILMLGALLLTGCASAPAATLPSQEQAVPDEAEATPEVKHMYTAENTLIVRDDGKVIYDASPYYFTEDGFCGIDKLVDDGEALYFEEYGLKLDSDPDSDVPASDYTIVRIDYDGQNRQELVSKFDIGGYSNLTAFGDRLFYVNEGSDCVDIGDVSKDGKEFNVVDWNEYTSGLGDDVAFDYASLTKDENYLYVQLNLFEGELMGVIRDVRIDKNMKLEYMPLTEDQYILGDSNIILLSKDTGEKSVLYDASVYHKGDAGVYCLLKTEDRLIFQEYTFKNGTYIDHYSIVSIDKQGKNRNVLCSAPDDYRYNEMTLFDNCVFFSESSDEENRIGYVALGGGDVSYINLSPDRMSDSVLWMETEGDLLKIDMNRTADYSKYTICIDKGLTVTVGDYVD